MKSRQQLKPVLKKELRCSIILVSLGWDRFLAKSPFLELLTQAFIVPKTGINWIRNRQVLKTLAVSFLQFLRSAISSIAGLFYLKALDYNLGLKQSATVVSYGDKKVDRAVARGPIDFVLGHRTLGSVRTLVLKQQLQLCNPQLLAVGVTVASVKPFNLFQFSRLLTCIRTGLFNEVGWSTDHHFKGQ